MLHISNTIMVILKPGTEIGCWLGPCFCRCIIEDYKDDSEPFGGTYGVRHGSIISRIYPNDIWVVKDSF